jgi:hypothetical protein
MVDGGATWVLLGASLERAPLGSSGLINPFGRPIVMTKSKTMSRRAVFAGVALAVPASAALAATSTAATPIARLWAEAEALGGKLGALRSQITEAAGSGGISGWMRMGGEANAIGARRYDALVAILNSAPREGRDLAIMGKVVLDDEVQNGAKGWAAEQFAKATVGFHGAMAA